ncbi:hypothetical protein OPV22_033985 [Ensete ventricosum]|uniref:Uncharacterized protein n=1 Tax=Ensete ventricosum TaxID=4639 RepID=A0AAV8PVP6_ENSVE|nr:hypothetical protein OPV22_033985 [Ensete ventricosum]
MSSELTVVAARQQASEPEAERHALGKSSVGAMRGSSTLSSAFAVSTSTWSDILLDSSRCTSRYLDEYSSAWSSRDFCSSTLVRSYKRDDGIIDVLLAMFPLVEERASCLLPLGSDLINWSVGH